ncbi:hypothetical protein ABEB36_001270 [Hypothenemus hampei]|uniref:P-type domain-containing protein n=1 Tax=Hypothenemus hampei TaxID=57062 RepID=A0ABD1FE03_HYPHA
MKIRNIITSFRGDRSRKMSSSTSVSFEEFCNEQPPQYRFPGLKEPSSFDISPVKHSVSSYKRFAHDPDIEGNTSRPSLATVLLFIVLLAVFLILPIIYLLNCFDIIYEHQNLKHNPIVQSPGGDTEAVGEINDVLASALSNEYKGLSPPPVPDYNQCKLLENGDKFDCFPDVVNQEACEARGCCWIPLNTKSKNFSAVSMDTPYCFYPPSYRTYQVLNMSSTAFGVEAFIGREYSTGYPDDVPILKLTVRFETENRLHVKFTDPFNSRFEPPYPEVPLVDKAAPDWNYSFEMRSSDSGFKVLRKSGNVTIFDSNNFLDLTFANQFLQISSRLPSKYIYGIGEQTTNLLLDTQWTQYTLWNHDIPPLPNRNEYGSHPFYMVMENSSNSHGVFLLNSNAMDIKLQPTPAITFRTIGGVLDLYFFLGPTPGDVIAQYTELVGRPYMPPYWGLGFHLCRYGYKSLNDTRDILEKNLNAGIFIDTQWNDLDYMKNNNDFTYNKDTYDGLPEFVEDLHKRGMHYIPLIDPGISAGEEAGTYPPYDEGIKMDIFVKNSSGLPFIGKVWNPISTVWPDFTHPNTVDYWTQMLKDFHNVIPFDGAWIDMNEPSNFYSGAIDGCPKSDLENPPYVPNVLGGVLNQNTICMTAKQYAGLHYDVHNLYGISEGIVTSFAMAEIRGKRPMVISRSTFSGFGHYAGHWSGDVLSNWDGLKYSIPHLLSFSLYGIPLMGADICGFNGDTTEALCNRWHQLGAFYPFARNHNSDNTIPQDPVSLGELVVNSTKKALQVRYALLPYLYTLFYRAHVWGETVARPLFFEFFTDTETWSIDSEFLWGSGLLIVPVLQEGATSVNAYFPQGLWYDYYTKNTTESKGQYINVSAPLDTIPVFVRGGNILSQQEARPTTTETRTTKIQLLVAPNENGEAFGELYWDDGDSLNTIEEKQFSLINFALENSNLRSQIENWAEEYPPNLGSVTVMGIQKAVSEVTVNNVSLPFTFDTIRKYLVVDDLDISLENPLVVAWK